MVQAQSNSDGMIHDASLLRNNPSGVLLENRKRRIQNNTGSYSISLNPNWAQNLDIDSISSPTSHYFVTGKTPIVITQPAIIIQPNGGELNRGSE